ncbi:MAG: NapC/NirT family cytochrome c [Clostridia bacterium]|nr:NapC/NirT family cytochrome c [Clostridia bacterium]
MNKEKGLKLLIIITGVLLFGLVGTAAGMKYSSQPDFCTKCHIMEPAVEVWATNPHKSVTCLDCHADPGTVGYVKQKIRGLGELYEYLNGNYDGKFTARINEVNCINCHSKDSKIEKAKDITATEGPKAPGFPHMAIVEANLSCLECHKNFVHGKGQKDNEKEKVCLVCHSKDSKIEKAKDITATEGPRAVPFPSHQDLLKSNMPCAGCHKDVQHGKKK